MGPVVRGARATGKPCICSWPGFGGRITALACHLAQRARAVRFAPHRLSLEGMAEQESQNTHTLAREIGGGATLATAAGPARRPGTLTATKLIRVALQNAASIAGLMVTTECLVTELPEKAKNPAMPAGGGTCTRHVGGLPLRV